MKLAPAYLGPAVRYALLGGGLAVTDPDTRYDKRAKATHRCLIADVNGPLRLTVPVAHAEGARRWSDVLVSDHGKWASEHITALESAYGRTPYFEYYIDDLASLLREAPGRRLTDLDADLDALILRLLQLPRTDAPAPSPDEAERRRRALLALDPASRPYPQVRQERFGFIAGLSVVDLLFSLGPDAGPYLLSLAD